MLDVRLEGVISYYLESKHGNFIQSPDFDTWTLAHSDQMMWRSQRLNHQLMFIR